jgi:nucleotide-binding universal stress UspA family protein
MQPGAATTTAPHRSAGCGCANEGSYASTAAIRGKVAWLIALCPAAAHGNRRRSGCSTPKWPRRQRIGASWPRWTDPADRLVVEWAVDEAALRGRPMLLAHVPAAETGSGLEPQDVIEAALGVAASRSATVQVEGRVLAGTITTVLLGEAAAAAVVVLGSGRRVDTGRVWPASIALPVIAHAPCPVVVARSPMAGEHIILDIPDARVGRPAEGRHHDPGQAASIKKGARPPRQRSLAWREIGGQRPVSRGRCRARHRLSDRRRDGPRDGGFP